MDSGKFYPSTAKSAEDRLKFYASEFPIVEVDSSYYGIPRPENGQLWAERTPLCQYAVRHLPLTN